MIIKLLLLQSCNLIPYVENIFPLIRSTIEHKTLFSDYESCASSPTRKFPFNTIYLRIAFQSCFQRINHAIPTAGTGQIIDKYKMQSACYKQERCSQMLPIHKFCAAYFISTLQINPFFLYNKLLSSYWLDIQRERLSSSRFFHHNQDSKCIVTNKNYIGS